MRSNIYIRKENEEAWKAIEDKSAFVNDLLRKEELGNQLGHGLVGQVQDRLECQHLHVNKRTGVCKDCGAYVR